MERLDHDESDSFAKHYDAKVQFHKIFVGGLSWETNINSLRNYFTQFGEVEDSIIMSDRKTGQPRGFGFVTMTNTTVVDTIISMQHIIDKKEVDVKKAVPKEAKSLLEKSESNKIFVGGLPNDLKEAELSQYFNKFGSIIDVIVMVDRNTNRSRGFGFVTFEKDETVDFVLRQQIVINNKWIEVKRAEPRQNDLRSPKFSPTPNMMQSYHNYSNLQYNSMIYSSDIPLEYSQVAPLTFIDYNGAQYLQYFHDQHEGSLDDDFTHLDQNQSPTTRFK